MLIMKAKTRRNGELVELPAEELVPGDIVTFEAGDKVAADGRLLTAAALEIEEAGLTGESAPVAKDLAPIDRDEVPLGDRLDMAYMNSTVTRGRGEMIVTATGMQSEVGRISGMLTQVEEEKTPLTKQLDQLTVLITGAAGVALVLVVALGLARDQSFDDMFLLGITLAIAAIPTGMPAVVTTLLSMGTQELAKRGAIVKRLRSVETLGSTSAICSDKTGTLTLNQMTARELVLPGRRYTIDGEGYSTEGRLLRVTGEGDPPFEPIMLPMALASDAVVIGRRTRRRPDGGRGRRAGRQGRARRRRDAQDLPAHRRGALRFRVQVHGHLPPHASGRRPTGRPLLRQGCARRRARPLHLWPQRRRRTRGDRPVPAAGLGRERTAGERRVARAGHGVPRFRSGHL